MSCFWYSVSCLAFKNINIEQIVFLKTHCPESVRWVRIMEESKKNKKHNKAHRFSYQTIFKEGEEDIGTEREKWDQIFKKDL